MSYFIILGRYGPARQSGVALHDGIGWDEHCRFMDELTDEGLILLGGPYGERGDRIVLVACAESREQIVERLAEDPWRESQTLLAPEVEPWDVRIGDPSAARVS